MYNYKKYFTNTSFSFFVLGFRCKTEGRVRLKGRALSRPLHAYDRYVIYD
jgi:hypothetical protein